MQDFTKLRAWQHGHQLALEVVRALPAGRCRGLPGLRSQAMRAAMAIPANLAEGCGKASPSNWRTMSTSRAGRSSSSTPTCDWPKRARLLPLEEYAVLATSVERLRKMLIALARAVRVRSAEAGPAPLKTHPSRHRAARFPPR